MLNLYWKIYYLILSGRIFGGKKDFYPTSTIYQLQAEICCTFALEDDDIQGLEHFY